MKKRRMLVFALVLCVLIGVLPLSAAMAAPRPAEDVQVQVMPIIMEDREGTAGFILTNSSGGELTLIAVTPEVSPADNPALLSVTSAFTSIVIQNGQTINSAVALSAPTAKVGSTVKLKFTFSDGSYVFQSATVLWPTETPSGGTGAETLPNLVLDSTGLDGLPIAAPSGDAGDTIKVVLPILNRGSTMGADGYYFGSNITNIEITPQLSADLNEFPFEIKELDYKRTISFLPAGSKGIVEYNLKLSSNVTSGPKAVTFNAVYLVDGVAKVTKFQVFVNVIKGAAAPGGDGTKVSEPKVIIKSYSVEPETVLAGETFKLSMELQNTSDKEDVKNVKITVQNGDNLILPAASGSSTLYVSKIAKGKSTTVSLDLQSTPDIPAKAHLISVAFNYEGGSSLVSYDVTEQISINIVQPIRIRLDEPTIGGDGFIGQSIYASMKLYNMGKSTIYNCMLDVDAPGLRMEETFYGGNITSGSTIYMDFNLIPEQAGQIQGDLVVTYEDVYGKQYEERVPVTVNVMEQMMEDPGVWNPEEPFPEEKPIDGGGMSWWLIAGICLAAVAVIVIVLMQVRKARRRRELEEA